MNRCSKEGMPCSNKFKELPRVSDMRMCLVKHKERNMRCDISSIYLIWMFSLSEYLLTSQEIHVPQNTVRECCSLSYVSIFNVLPQHTELQNVSKETCHCTVRKQGQGCQVTGPKSGELLANQDSGLHAWPRAAGPVLFLLFHTTHAWFTGNFGVVVLYVRINSSLPLSSSVPFFLSLFLPDMLEHPGLKRYRV